MTPQVTVVGAGLAGCEAAWALAQAGVPVLLREMKPEKYSPAHTYPGFAELVCSNSLKAMRLESAAGLLKEEMRMLGSVTMEAAARTAVSAGGALAVDRRAFSDEVTGKIRSHPLIQVEEGEVTRLPQGPVILATGPLTSQAFTREIETLCGGKGLSFFDAAAPIVTAASLDQEKIFYAARYDRGEADYINCPMSKAEYEAFYQELIHGETAPLHNFDQASPQVYEGCMPIEVLAKRGEDAIRYGPLKPVGLRDPRTGHRPWAVVQLRRENAEGSLYNMVGFQTNLKFGEQKRIFSLIPGLEQAEFVRYGVMHRNTFIDSPRLLEPTCFLRDGRPIAFAGQITGVEGYIESAACGILAGKNMARRLAGRPPLILPRETMLGALAAYISDPTVVNFQPMGSNMGILPPLDKPIRDKRQRYAQIAQRAVDSLRAVLEKEE
ncbi:MAG TPA: methylenetetrahydrofolate--tRNA-(uracil(54)-C(5))-methyltransferase (FADH(2)-oxidizing) TrmFO [Firmicutes bacterium]|nr:methylenetetrahydrofolate--tRNA-(uracil(54)-C(5))-methyltransferase (FADH(2)-oxidizing) TrmFO [Bacillota bacterium]